MWTGSFYVLREDGSLSSYASKDIQGQTPVKVIDTCFFFLCVLYYFCGNDTSALFCGTTVHMS